MHYALNWKEYQKKKKNAASNSYAWWSVATFECGCECTGCGFCIPWAILLMRAKKCCLRNLRLQRAIYKNILQNQPAIQKSNKIHTPWNVMYFCVFLSVARNLWNLPNVYHQWEHISKMLIKYINLDISPTVEDLLKEWKRSAKLAK